VLSTTSSLIQAWLARSSHTSAQNPYFLYVASNVGSMIGLLAYPLLLQPLLRLQTQSWFWSAGYGVLAALLLLSTWMALRNTRPAQSTQTQTDAHAHADKAETIGWVRRLRWVLLAFVPSSLMLSVTNYISTDITPVPLLWVIPLALYLLTFILVFANKRLFAPATVRMAFMVLLVLLTASLMATLHEPLWLVLPLHILTFFVAALMCHGMLADDRPSAGRLTEFYLWMSVGGALGGTFNAMVAPLVFTTVAEYPIVLAVAALLMLPWSSKQTGNALTRDVVFALVLMAVVGGALLVIPNFSFTTLPVLTASVIALAGLVCLIWSQRVARFAFGMAAVLAVGTLWSGAIRKPIAVARSFFGVNRVTFDRSLNAYALTHGTTVHGKQFRTAELQCTPMSYYYRTGPIGQAFLLNEAAWQGARIAVVGLGAGGLGAYAQPQQAWTFFEIDPEVAALASNPNYFTYLSKCAPQSKLVLGDARLTLAQQPTAGFDVIIMDAYSSDAIPLHLITREALHMYQSRLAEGGVLVFHVSNRYFNLAPVLANLAADSGWVSLRNLDLAVSEADAKSGKSPSEWVVMARSPQDLATFAADQRWKPLLPNPAAPLWTDDFASLLPVLRAFQGR
jgi:hypothetical protein